MINQGNEYKIERTRGGLKKILTLSVVLIFVALLVGLIYYFTKVNQAASSESREHQVVVQKGSTTKEIANQLGEQKIISSTWIFLVYTTLNNASDKIQAGEYLLNANMPITEIVDILTHGKVISNERSFTTIEGWTNAQIASYLKSRQLISHEVEFADALQKTQFEFRFNDQAEKFNYQGFLFPDTYRIGKEEGIDDLAQKMLSNFDSKITEKMLSDIGSAGKTMEEIVILASIIEKEVGRNKSVLTDEDITAMQRERELVASVFYNRLAIGMALESDATVNYISGKKDRQVLIEDTKINSPYNTYRVKGLTPGPISNPGIGSIMAAIYPANTDYLFFLNKPDGEAVFAETLTEHNENRAEFLD